MLVDQSWNLFERRLAGCIRIEFRLAIQVDTLPTA